MPIFVNNYKIRRSFLPVWESALISIVVTGGGGCSLASRDAQWVLLSQAGSSSKGFLSPPRIVFSNRQHHPTRRPGSPRSTSNPRVSQTRIYVSSSFYAHADVLTIFSWQRLAEAPALALAPREPIYRRHCILYFFCNCNVI